MKMPAVMPAFVLEKEVFAALSGWYAKETAALEKPASLPEILIAADLK